MSLSRSIALGVSTGLLLCAAHGFFAGLSWLAPIPLLFALMHCNAKTAFYTGLVCGIFESLILFGLSHAGTEVYVSIALMYGLSRALFALSFVALRQGDYLRLLAPALWVFFEWTQAQLPLTLPNLIGDTLHGAGLFGVVRLGGTYLLGALVVWAAAIAVRFIQCGGWADSVNQALFYLWLCSFCVCQLVGTAFTPREKSTIEVALVQGGVPTWLYARGEQVPAWHSISEKIYTELTLKAQPAALTIWPETAVDETYSAGNDFALRLGALAQNRGALLVGSRRADEGGTLYNSAILLGEGAPKVVDKKRLALRAEGHFAIGETSGILEFQDYKLGIVFCLESVMPKYASDLVDNHEADLLVVLADGSRFGNTLVGRMHAQRSTLRAVEAGRSLMHVGQHGLTHVVSAEGIHSKFLPAFAGDVLNHEVKIYEGVTPFHRLRHLMGYGLGLMLALSLFLTFFRKNQRAA
jgi:apolipoprotein N-acyltransferase